MTFWLTSGAALSAVLVRLRSARETMVVGSVAVLLPLREAGSPPPENRHRVGHAAAAVCETVTVMVMTG